MNAKNEPEEDSGEEGLLEDLSKKDLKVFWILVAIVVGILLAFWGWAEWQLNDKERGVFGDQFGAVNALFSGLAFCGLIIAILLQRKELKLQRRELADTRKVLLEQKDQIREQKEALKQQVFETTFFNLIGQYEIAVRNVRYGDRQGGEETLHHFFQKTIGLAFNQLGGKSGSEITEFLVARLDQQNATYKALLDKPMHILESASDYLIDAGFEAKKETFYAEYLAGNLSDVELKLLSLYALTIKGASMKSRVEKLGLLTDLERVFAGQAQLATQYEFLRLEKEKEEAQLHQR